MNTHKIALSLIVITAAPWSWAGVRVRPASDVTGEHIDWINKVADWQLTQSTWNSGRNWEHGALFAGMMAAYEATKDETYLDKTRQWAQQYNWRMGSDSRHADNHACGQAFLELYLLDAQDSVRYAHSKSVNDTMVNDPRHFYCNVSSGSTVWWWCDALFMHPTVHVRLSRVLNDPSYINLMHMMWEETQECLYDTEERLFYRDITYFNSRIGGQKVFWARGNGWVAAGLPRVLRYLPLNDPLRPRYETLLQQMASRLVEIQQPDGYWYANLLYPQQFNVPETSGTGFFCYMLAWGINNGYLDAATYWPATEKAWEALKGAVHPNGKLGWVQPVGAGPAMSYWDSTQVYGVGAYLLAGSEVQKTLQTQSASFIDYFEGYTSDAALKAVWNDGVENGSTAQIGLGNYGDRFMTFDYTNAFPDTAWTERQFAAPRTFAVEAFRTLSVQIRGQADNAAGRFYVRLEDADGAAAIQRVEDTGFVRQGIWQEAEFDFSTFPGVDLNRVVKIRLGVDAASGPGSLRIDAIRLNPIRCETMLADFDSDCRIDVADLALLASHWLECGLYPAESCGD